MSPLDELMSVFKKVFEEILMPNQEEGAMSITSDPMQLRNYFWQFVDGVEAVGNMLDHAVAFPCDHDRSLHFLPTRGHAWEEWLERHDHVVQTPRELPPAIKRVSESIRRWQVPQVAFDHFEKSCKMCLRALNPADASDLRPWATLLREFYEIAGCALRNGGIPRWSLVEGTARDALAAVEQIPTLQASEPEDVPEICTQHILPVMSRLAALGPAQVLLLTKLVADHDDRVTDYLLAPENGCDLFSARLLGDRDPDQIHLLARLHPRLREDDDLPLRLRAWIAASAPKGRLGRALVAESFGEGRADFKNTPQMRPLDRALAFPGGDRFYLEELSSFRAALEALGPDVFGISWDDEIIFKKKPQPEAYDQLVAAYWEEWDHERWATDIQRGDVDVKVLLEALVLSPRRNHKSALLDALHTVLRDHEEGGAPELPLIALEALRLLPGQPRKVRERADELLALACSKFWGGCRDGTVAKKVMAGFLARVGPGVTRAMIPAGVASGADNVAEIEALLDAPLAADREAATSRLQALRRLIRGMLPVPGVTQPNQLSECEPSAEHPEALEQLQVRGPRFFPALLLVKKFPQINCSVSHPPSQHRVVKRLIEIKVAFAQQHKATIKEAAPLFPFLPLHRGLLPLLRAIPPAGKINSPAGEALMYLAAALEPSARQELLAFLHKRGTKFYRIAVDDNDSVCLVIYETKKGLLFQPRVFARAGQMVAVVCPNGVGREPKRFFSGPALQPFYALKQNDWEAFVNAVPPGGDLDTFEANTSLYQKFIEDQDYFSPAKVTYPYLERLRDSYEFVASELGLAPDSWGWAEQDLHGLPEEDRLGLCSFKARDYYALKKALEGATLLEAGVRLADVEPGKGAGLLEADEEAEDDDPNATTEALLALTSSRARKRGILLEAAIRSLEADTAWTEDRCKAFAQLAAVGRKPKGLRDYLRAARWLAREGGDANREQMREQLILEFHRPRLPYRSGRLREEALAQAIAAFCEDRSELKGALEALIAHHHELLRKNTYHPIEDRRETRVVRARIRAILHAMIRHNQPRGEEDQLTLADLDPDPDPDPQNRGALRTYGEKLCARRLHKLRKKLARAKEKLRRQLPEAGTAEVPQKVLQVFRRKHATLNRAIGQLQALATIVGEEGLAHTSPLQDAAPQTMTDLREAVDAWTLDGVGEPEPQMDDSHLYSLAPEDANRLNALRQQARKALLDRLLKEYTRAHYAKASDLLTSEGIHSTDDDLAEARRKQSEDAGSKDYLWSKRPRGSKAWRCLQLARFFSDDVGAVLEKLMAYKKTRSQSDRNEIKSKLLDPGEFPPIARRLPADASYERMLGAEPESLSFITPLDRSQRAALTVAAALCRVYTNLAYASFDLYYYRDQRAAIEAFWDCCGPKGTDPPTPWDVFLADAGDDFEYDYRTRLADAAAKTFLRHHLSELTDAYRKAQYEKNKKAIKEMADAHEMPIESICDSPEVDGDQAITVLLFQANTQEFSRPDTSRGAFLKGNREPGERFPQIYATYQLVEYPKATQYLSKTNIVPGKLPEILRELGSITRALLEDLRRQAQDETFARRHKHAFQDLLNDAAVVAGFYPHSLDQAGTAFPVLVSRLRASVDQGEPLQDPDYDQLISFLSRRARQWAQQDWFTWCVVYLQPQIKAGLDEDVEQSTARFKKNPRTVGPPAPSPELVRSVKINAISPAFHEYRASQAPIIRLTFTTTFEAEHHPILTNPDAYPAELKRLYGSTALFDQEVKSVLSKVSNRYSLKILQPVEDPRLFSREFYVPKMGAATISLRDRGARLSISAWHGHAGRSPGRHWLALDLGYSRFFAGAFTRAVEGEGISIEPVVLDGCFLKRIKRMTALAGRRQSAWDRADPLGLQPRAPSKRLQRGERGILKKAVRALLDFCKRRGVGHIALGDFSSSNEAASKGLRRASQIAPMAFFRQQLLRMAREEGISVYPFVPEAYSSQRCPRCGAIDRKNRPRRGFSCVTCGFEAHSDAVGATNILIAALPLSEAAERDPGAEVPTTVKGLTKPSRIRAEWANPTALPDLEPEVYGVPDAVSKALAEALEPNPTDSDPINRLPQDPRDLRLATKALACASQVSHQLPPQLAQDAWKAYTQSSVKTAAYACAGTTEFKLDDALDLIREINPAAIACGARALTHAGGMPTATASLAIIPRFNAGKATNAKMDLLFYLPWWCRPEWRLQISKYSGYEEFGKAQAPQYRGGIESTLSGMNGSIEPQRWIQILAEVVDTMPPLKPSMADQINDLVSVNQHLIPLDEDDEDEA